MLTLESLRLVPYEVNRTLLAAFAGDGHTVAVRRNRNGSVRVSLDGAAERDMHGTMKIVEAWAARVGAEMVTELAAQQYWDMAEAAKPAYYHCGSCEQWHAGDFYGDCRDDSARFNVEDLDERHGVDGWREVPMVPGELCYGDPGEAFPASEASPISGAT